MRTQLFPNDKNPHLVLSSTALRELKVDTTARQSAVDLGVSVESVVHTSLLLLIEDDLQDLAAIFLGAETLADDLDGEHEVGEDGVVDGGEGSGTRALLGLRSTRSVAALGAGKDTARGEDQDVAVRELLLELTGETVILLDHVKLKSRSENIPLLHLVEALKGWDGDKDDNSLLAVANFNLQNDQSQHASSTSTWSAARPIPRPTCNARRRQPKYQSMYKMCSIPKSTYGCVKPERIVCCRRPKSFVSHRSKAAVSIFLLL